MCLVFLNCSKSKCFFITKGSATMHIFPPHSNAQLRHSDFQGYLYHCVKQYTSYGQGSLTSTLCSWMDWNAWRQAVSGEARVVYGHIFSKAKLSRYIIYTYIYLYF